jgi:hypothetical protein
MRRSLSCEAAQPEIPPNALVTDTIASASANDASLLTAQPLSRDPRPSRQTATMLASVKRREGDGS